MKELLFSTQNNKIYLPQVLTFVGHLPGYLEMETEGVCNLVIVRLRHVFQQRVVKKFVQALSAGYLQRLIPGSTGHKAITCREASERSVRPEAGNCSTHARLLSGMHAKWIH